MLKKSLKKVISIMLTLTLLASMFTALPNTIFAADENLARGEGRTYEASSTYNAGIISVAAAFDGSTGDSPRWSAAVAGDSWIQVSFGEDVTFNNIRFFEGEGNNHYVNTVDVQLSDDGSSWESAKTFVIDTGSSNAHVFDMTFPVTAKYARFALSGGQGANKELNVREIEIYNIPDVEIQDLDVANGTIEATLAESVANVTADEFKIQIDKGEGYRDLNVYDFEYNAVEKKASFSFEPLAAVVESKTVSVKVTYRGATVKEATFTLGALSNVARGEGRSYSSSPYYDDGTYVLSPDKAFDGDITGDNVKRWGSGGVDGANPWIQVAFGETVAFNLMKVYETSGELNIASIIVMISDTGVDDSWETIGTFPFNTTDAPLKELDLVFPTEAQFVKFEFTKNIPTKDINVNEIEIYNVPVEGLYTLVADNGTAKVIFSEDVGVVTAENLDIQVKYANQPYQALPIYNFEFDSASKTASFKFNPIPAQVEIQHIMLSVSYNDLLAQEVPLTITGATNVARGDAGTTYTYTASSEDTRWGDMSPGKAFTGVTTGNGWASTDGSPQWLQVESSKPITINMARVYRPLGADYDRIRTITVMTSDDGEVWSEIGTASFSAPATNVMDVTLTSATSKYVRVVFAGSGNGINVTEVELYNVPFSANVNVIEDFESFTDGEAMLGSSLVAGQTRNVETGDNLSGDKSLNMINNSATSELDFYIDELIGKYNIMTQLVSLSGGKLNVTAVNGNQFTKADAYGYDRVLQEFVTIQWDDSGFTIPAGFDGYIFFTNTENYYLEDLCFGVAANSTMGIDNISACATDNYLKILLGFEKIRVEITAPERTTSSINIQWDPVAGATGYNVYRSGATNMNLTKVTSSPITVTNHSSTGLQPLKYYTFKVTAIVQGEEIDISDNAYFNTENKELEGQLLSSENRQLQLPFSDFALNMEFVGTALSDKDWYYWCLDPIDGDDGKTYMFAVRWPSRYGMEPGWLQNGEIVRAVSDTPDGPFEVIETILGNTTPNPGESTDALMRLPAGQRSPHNVRISKIDGKYVLVYIVQTGNQGQSGQKICMMTADNMAGPWEFAGDNGDGIVVEAAPRFSGHWTGGGVDTDGTPTVTIEPQLGVDNHDIIKIDGKYYIYFKAGGVGYTDREHNIFGFPTRSRAVYGYAVSDSLTGGYVKSDKPVTNNYSYIEDATVFEMNNKIYMLTCDNFGGDTTGNIGGNPAGYGLMWESQDRGLTFDKADAEIFYGFLPDYTAVPPYSAFLRGNSGKFERPAVLLRDGVPAYFYGANGTNMDGISATQNFIMKINLPVPVDKNALNALIEEVDGLIESDYTSSSWAKLQTALTAAKVTDEKEDATQIEVDAALEALEEAMVELVRLSEPTVIPTPTPDPTEPTPTPDPTEPTPTQKPTVTPITVPKVAKLAVTNNSANSLKISWNKVTGVNGYELHFATSKNGKYTLAKATTGVSFTHKKLKPKRTYYYKVRAYRNVNGKKVYGEYTSIVKKKVVLAKPKLTAKTRNKTSIKLTWKKINGAKRYEVYRATSKKGKYTKIATTKSTKYISKKLIRNKKYFYKIKAVQVVSKKKYKSSFSAIKSATTKK